MSPEDMEEALEEVRDFCRERIRNGSHAEAEMARDILLIIGEQ